MRGEACLYLRVATSGRHRARAASRKQGLCVPGSLTQGPFPSHVSLTLLYLPLAALPRPPKALCRRRPAARPSAPLSAGSAHRHPPALSSTRPKALLDGSVPRHSSRDRGSPQSSSRALQQLVSRRQHALHKEAFDPSAAQTALGKVTTAHRTAKPDGQFSALDLDDLSVVGDPLPSPTASRKTPMSGLPLGPRTLLRLCAGPSPAPGPFDTPVLQAPLRPCSPPSG